VLATASQAPNVACSFCLTDVQAAVAGVQLRAVVCTYLAGQCNCQEAAKYSKRLLSTLLLRADVRSSRGSACNQDDCSLTQLDLSAV
jgi:hypothetical protein